MSKTNDRDALDDRFNLRRFTSAQENIYSIALAELKSGQKRSHWMWYIFPQIDGLGHSLTTIHYAIKSLEEARQYLDHPILGKRLLECAETVLHIQGRTISQIFGYPDDMKLKSSMTLFADVADADSVFVRVLEKYFDGERDILTLRGIEDTA
jgi:uncharacterized protein (DUF1810 family)